MEDLSPMKELAEAIGGPTVLAQFLGGPHDGTLTHVGRDTELMRVAVGQAEVSGQTGTLDTHESHDGVPYSFRYGRYRRIHEMVPSVPGNGGQRSPASPALYWWLGEED